MKKITFILFVLLFVLVSCAPTVVVPPADQISGNYTGQYTFNASINNGVIAAVTKVNDNSVTINFSGSGISPLTISNISIVANDNSFALTKTGMTEAMSGAVSDGELSVSYSYIGGAVSFVGNK